MFMAKALMEIVPQIDDWQYTSSGDPRGYIQPQYLRELWFHTGTVCNLQCPFCFEGASPGNQRLQSLTLEDAKPFMDEAVALGVEQFSFTGGEPFVIRDMVSILDYALDYKPCLVLTNATKPLLKRLDDVGRLNQKPNSLTFRVSLDSPDAKIHDKNRGEGNFKLSLQVMGKLYQLGFKVMVARQSHFNEDSFAIDRAYLPLFQEVGLPDETHIVAFPDLFSPDSHPDVPQITESCMTTYKTQEEREEFMCNYSKMVLKKSGKMHIYACTLVDDDPDYDLGDSLVKAMEERIMLRHHRCFKCFSLGTSCSQT